MEKKRGPRLPWISDHIRLYQENPEQAHLWDASIFGGQGLFPTLLLTTIGRKSQLPNLAPIIYGEFDGNFIVVASKGGAPSHPAWYLNLDKDADCKIQIVNDHHHCKARTAAGAERALLWAKMILVYPLYVDYQSKTDREIPVVVLEPQA